ncbi:hypothetical protein F442_20302, partial [Phytophthora nicotianae P10297]
MMSLNLARRLKLKLSSHKQIRVSGLGGVPTYISTSARVKLTLGPRVVYILELWVANIGEGVDVLLGMDFMFSAGVRLGIREGLVKLPDEETLLMYDKTIKRLKQGRPVTPGKDYYLRPGEQVVVPIHYGSNHPLQDVVWAGRGDRWVTQLIYGAKSWVTAVKVVNISNRDLVLEWNVIIAEIVPYGSFPQAGRFVRPGLRRYLEWQQLIHENTESKQARLRAR